MVKINYQKVIAITRSWHQISSRAIITPVGWWWGWLGHRKHSKTHFLRLGHSGWWRKLLRQRRQRIWWFWGFFGFNVWVDHQSTGAVWTPDQLATSGLQFSGEGMFSQVKCFDYKSLTIIQILLFTKTVQPHLPYKHHKCNIYARTWDFKKMLCQQLLWNSSKRTKRKHLEIPKSLDFLNRITSILISYLKYLWAEQWNTNGIMQSIFPPIIYSGTDWLFIIPDWKIITQQ